MSAIKFNGKVDARITFPSFAVARLTGEVYVTNRGILPGVAVVDGSVVVAMVCCGVVSHIQMSHLHTLSYVHLVAESEDVSISRRSGLCCPISESSPRLMVHKVGRIIHDPSVQLVGWSKWLTYARCRRSLKVSNST